MALIVWIKPALQKSHFCFDQVNRLIMNKLLLAGAGERERESFMYFCVKSQSKITNKLFT